MRRTFTSTVFFLVIVSAAVCAQAQTGWFDPAWAYRNQLNVQGTGTALSAFQVRIALDASFDFSKANAAGADMRITTGDGTTAIPFWIEQWTAGASQAIIWARVPSIPAGGTTLYLYYGNAAAQSASDGNATFDFFDDFESGSGTAGYFSLGAPEAVLPQSAGWETGPPYTLSVVQANSGGFTYWGYYGATGCGGIGLARGNDLSNWTKFGSAPVVANGAWPSVVYDGSAFSMVYTNCTSGALVLATSTDGITFTTVKTVVSKPGFITDNPDLFWNPADGKYYLYWYTTASPAGVRVRSASTPSGLDNAATETTLGISDAGPNVVYANGKYYLATQANGPGGIAVQTYSSASPTSGFTLLPGNPILPASSACMMQHVFGTTVHDYYCSNTGSGWQLLHRTGDVTQTSQSLALDATKWTGIGAQWQIVSDAQQDGAAGGVLKGTLSGSSVLRSTFSGADYVVDVYGKQLSGRVWGVGVRTSDASNFYSTNLYEDLDGTRNLYMYGWVGGAATTLGNAATGAVNLNTWYKLTVKVHGNSLEAYRDGNLQISTSAASFASGSIAAYGESGTVAEWNNVLVRKYAATEPTVTLGPGGTQAISSLTLNPAGVFGGDSSQGTVVLANAAPSGGAVVGLSSSNAGVATVPASVTVAQGQTSASFTVQTQAVSANTQVTISATYGGGTQQAQLSVSPLLAGVTLNPASVSGGQTSQGTVVLAAAAPAGGIQIGLSSSNTAVATVPASVTVAQGQTSASFTVQTQAVSANTQVTISATYGGGTQQAQLSVSPLLAGVTLNPASVSGGQTSQGTVVLAAAAPAGGIQIGLSSSNTAAATVPASVTVAQGQTSASFTVQTGTVSSSTAVVITASQGSATQQATLTVVPEAAWIGGWAYRSAVTIANPGGTPLSGFQVRLALGSGFNFSQAKSDGSDVRFADSDGVTLLPYWMESWKPAQSQAVVWVRVPTIAAGGGTIFLYYGNAGAASAASGMATFEFFDDFSGGTLSQWTASGGTWTLTSDTRPDGSSGTVVRGSTGGQQVLLSSYTGSNYVAEAYGKQLSGRVWGLGTRATDSHNLYSTNLYEDLDGSENLWVYRWLGGSAATVGNAATGTVNPNTWYKLTVKVHGTTVEALKDGVPQVTGTDSQLASGRVALYGETGTVAEWATVLARKWAAAEPTATVGGAIGQAISSLTLNPAGVLGGNSSQGTVVLAAAAPSGGAVVGLSSSNTAVATVPASVTVAQGQTSASFTVQTQAVSANTQVTISATYGGGTQQAQLSVSPLLAGVTLNPASVSGGQTSQGTVMLAAAAPAGGIQIGLSSSNTAAATVPASVTVAQGQTSASFTVQTGTVSSSTAVVITASQGSATQQATLTVVPEAAWIGGWAYRSAVTIANPGGTPLSGFQVRLALGSGFNFSQAKSDGSDVRFADSDGVTLLPYWMESWKPAQSQAVVWVRVPTIAAGGGTIFLYYGNAGAASAASGMATFEFFDDFSGGTLSQWTASGGTWTLTSDTRPDGSSGTVVRGSTGGQQVLLSSYTGSNYVAEAYGKQLSGRVWGLGTRATDSHNLYSTNLYEDLDGSENLWVYRWLGGSAATVGNAATGTVDPNTWYKLTVKVHGTTVEALKDGVPQVTGTDSQLASGRVALYGETGTVAEWATVLARKWAAAEPTATVGGAIGQAISSLTLNPAGVLGGNSSQGTVVLAAAAPSGGAVVGLSSSNAGVATVPASVTVAQGQTSASFTVQTQAVAQGTSVSITASYGGTGLVSSLQVWSSAPPVISNAQANPNESGATITWTTNIASTSLVDYGTTSSYGAAVGDPTLVSSHSLSIGGLACGTLYHYRITSSDSNNNASSTPDLTFTTSTCGGPTIDIWYGDTQTFGQNGIPQQWVNILGHVSDASGVSSITYSLNGGPPEALTIDPGQALRIAYPGDFNAEIAYTALNAGSNTVVFTATNSVGFATQRTVTVIYIAGQTWPSNYAIDWSTVSNIQDVAQIVDGKWQIQNGGVRVMQIGYDRLIDLGDKTGWTNYQVSAEVTINSTQPQFAFGLIGGWQGHTLDSYGSPYLTQPLTGHPFTVFAAYTTLPNSTTKRLALYQNTATQPESYMATDATGMQLTPGVKYNLKVRMQANAQGGTHYQMKVWRSGTTEPSAWLLEADGDLSRGSLLLAAHQCDVSFGKVTVTGL